MQWFYAKDGQQLGPVEFSEIERLHAAGEITGETLVWQQGTASWVKLHTLLAGGAPAVPPLSGAPAIPATPGAPVPTGPKTNTLSILSLVFGIVGLFCCILFAIGAIVCGFIAQGQIKTSGENGKGLALAGIILGFVGLVVQLIFIAINFTSIMAAAASGAGS